MTVINIKDTTPEAEYGVFIAGQPIQFVSEGAYRAMAFDDAYDPWEVDRKLEMDADTYGDRDDDSEDWGNIDDGSGDV